MKPEWIICPTCKEIIIMKEKDMHQDGIPGKWIPREFAEERDKMRAIIKEMGNLLEDFYDFRGCWRPVVSKIEEIDWQAAQPDDTIPLIWPLGLEDYFTLYPTNVIVIAGEKNSGKTSFALNLAYLNALNSPLPIHYFSSEMLAQELSVRVSKFPSSEPFKNTHFFPLPYDSEPDIIEPDAINIVDFLEVEDEFWRVGKKIRKMWEKLKKGIVVVAVQKDPDARLGRGKAFSAEKARVYLTMTKQQKMTLAEVKNFKGDKKPDGMVIPYQFGPDALLTRRVTAPAPSKNNIRPLPNRRDTNV